MITAKIKEKENEKKRHMRFLVAFLVPAVALILGAAAPEVLAKRQFEVANIFFELNDTDGDLGIHALIDGEPWKELEIESPDGREMLEIEAKSRLRRQGLTELFFESAEPTFDELDPEDFFRRFPEGKYEIEGVTLDWKELESVAELTHLLPAPVVNIEVNGEPVPEDCDEDPIPVSAPFIITWTHSGLSHPDLGRTNEPIEVDRYQVVVEREDDTLKFTVDLTPDFAELEIPEGFFEPGDEVKLEILVREESGNQTAVETCFEVE